jgi:hypothetical protein
MSKKSENKEFMPPPEDAESFFIEEDSDVTAVYGPDELPGTLPPIQREGFKAALKTFFGGKIPGPTKKEQS